MPITIAIAARDDRVGSLIPIAVKDSELGVDVQRVGGDGAQADRQQGQLSSQTGSRPVKDDTGLSGFQSRRRRP